MYDIEPVIINQQQQQQQQQQHQLATLGAAQTSTLARNVSVI